MRKKDSVAWKMAKKIAARKHTLWEPVELLPNDCVLVRSLVRGNSWVLSLSDLQERA